MNVPLRALLQGYRSRPAYFTAISGLLIFTLFIFVPKPLKKDVEPVSVVAQASFQTEAEKSLPSNSPLDEQSQTGTAIDTSKIEPDESAAAKNSKGKVSSSPAPKVNAPPAKRASYPASVDKWKTSVEKYPWPVEQALAVMACESGGNPLAISPTNDYGLFQIHNGLTSFGSIIYTPEENIRIAYEHYYKHRGWQPWTCARRLGFV